MFAQITIKVEKDFPGDLDTQIPEKLGKCSDKFDIFDKSELSNSSNSVKNNLKFAQKNNVHLYLILQLSPNEVQIHIENNNVKSSGLDSLRNSIFQIYERFESCNFQGSDNPTSMDVQIWAEDDIIMEGKRLSFFDWFIDEFKEKWGAKVYAIVFSIVATWILVDYKILKLDKLITELVSFGVVLLGVLFWSAGVANYKAKNQPFKFKVI